MDEYKKNHYIKMYAKIKNIISNEVEEISFSDIDNYFKQK